MDSVYVVVRAPGMVFKIVPLMSRDRFSGYALMEKLNLNCRLSTVFFTFLRLLR